MGLGCGFSEPNLDAKTIELLQSRVDTIFTEKKRCLKVFFVYFCIR